MKRFDRLMAEIWRTAVAWGSFVLFLVAEVMAVYQAYKWLRII